MTGRGRPGHGCSGSAGSGAAIKGVMNMSIYTNLKTDYSGLFSGLSGSRSSSSSNFLGINLSEYASIKSGAYGKALRAYYAKDASESTGSTSNESKTKKTNSQKIKEDTVKKSLSEIKGDADDLNNAVSKLTVTGTKSLFNKKDITTTNEDGTKTTKNDYDRNAIYSSVNTFVNEYNTLLKSASSSAAGNNTERALSNMKSLTDIYKNQLDKVGISVDANGKLSIDEETFKKADMIKVKGLFNGSSSYANSVGNYASTISGYASSDMKFGSTYTSSGNYNPFESGINYNSFF